jgi:hypothetical protein
MSPTASMDRCHLCQETHFLHYLGRVLAPVYLQIIYLVGPPFFMCLTNWRALRSEIYRRTTEGARSTFFPLFTRSWLFRRLVLCVSSS